MPWHGYTLQNNLPPGLTDPQQHQAWQAVLAIGLHTQPMPHNNTHARLQLDAGGLILEALFEPHELHRPYLVQLIATAIGLPYDPIDALLTYAVFAPGGTWQQSRQACLAYIRAHRPHWEAPEP